MKRLSKRSDFLTQEPSLLSGHTWAIERGVEGQLVGIDGDDGIIKLPDGDYKIMDMSNLVKVVDARGFGS